MSSQDGEIPRKTSVWNALSYPALVPPHLSQAGKGRSISEVAWPLTSPPEHTKLSITGQTGCKKSRIQVKLATNKDKDWGKSPLERTVTTAEGRGDMTRILLFPSIHTTASGSPFPVSGWNTTRATSPHTCLTDQMLLYFLMKKALKRQERCISLRIALRGSQLHIKKGWMHFKTPLGKRTHTHPPPSLLSQIKNPITIQRK